DDLFLSLRETTSETEGNRCFLCNDEFDLFLHFNILFHLIDEIHAFREAFSLHFLRLRHDWFEI
ncbi:hypothetical protein PFISCL1PPCAC_27106, partial [Pristionchus fissidentatus]